MKQHTPLIKQYCDLKEQYDDCVLFFRVGDFYEMFFDDAKKASKILNIALTSHGKNDVPMCGLPYHASESYIGKMINQGHKIALCEQVEDVSDRFDKKQPLKRDVVRVITPGTVTESSMLDPKSYNFLLCCSPIKKNKIGYSIVDLSVGDLFIEELESVDDLKNIFAKWNPRECLIPESVLNDEKIWKSISEWHCRAQIIPDIKYNVKQSEINLKNIYKINTLESFGTMSENELLASGFIAQYIMYTQKTSDIDLKPIAKVNNRKFVHLDKFTMDNLEVIKTLQGSNKGSLFETLDDTLTSGGGRLLKLRLTSPLKNANFIKERLNSVEFFTKNENIISEIRKHLSECDDLDRILGGIVLNRSGPLDLIKIANSLIASKNIHKIINQLEHPQEIAISMEYLDCNDLVIEKIMSAIIDSPPIKINDGGFIKHGYNNQLDDLIKVKHSCEEDIKMLQDQYRKETDISSLKIKHSNLFGYCIEIPTSQKKKMPFHFNEKQNLATVSRYITDILSVINDKMINNHEKILELELEIFGKLIRFIKSFKKEILLASNAIAVIDLTTGLANISIKNQYIKPIIDDSNSLKVKNGRNPIVENILNIQKEQFTPNDCDLNKEKCILMTGPNMAGKSTYLRQNALIILMAQVGCYVPAQQAHIGVFDGIFVRIGASDNLSKGMSTFMTEMVEVACILNNSTENSFIVVDEVGRGTSTDEGQAIASAVMENISERKIRSLFATHYHQLIEVSSKDENIICMTMDIKDIDGNLVFLHKVIPGYTKKSYALDVCKMAGIPNDVINRAEVILANNE